MCISWAVICCKREIRQTRSPSEIKTMEARRNPYTKFDDNDYDVNGVPRQCPPPYSPGRGGVPHNSTVIVTQPGPVVQQFESPPSSFMWLSILSCFFCWPMAICAISLSKKSVAAAGRGDYTTARERGRTAMKIALAAIIIGIKGLVIVAVVAVVVFIEEETPGQLDNYNSNTYTYLKDY